MKKHSHLLSLLAAVILLTSACLLNPTSTSEPYKITGSFKVTNDFVIATYFVEHAVALVDMHGFVVRNEEWQIPVEDQVLGFMKVDVPNLSGTYELDLPIHPEGVQDDVDNNGKTNTGVQIYAVAYWPNLTGGPYSEGDDPSFGWPSYLASVKTDAANQYEVTGGKLVIWASDGNQSFPTSFGTDGKLFTTDDPVARLQAGWTVVDLDQKPFALIRDAQPAITLYEPTELALKDFSKLSYLDAYDQMFQFVSTHYAFNGIDNKSPDWQALNAEIRPRVEQAQTNKDASAYYLALRDFTWAFHDGHTGLSGGDIQNKLFQQDIAGGYGFSIRQLDDGRFLVIYVLDSADSPAKSAGIQVGAVVTQFNGKPIEQAVSEVQPWSLPMSSDWYVRYQQARYLLRAKSGTQATITFTNPGGETKTATLTAIAETQSFTRTSTYYNAPTNVLPVEYRILDSGVGYVAIFSYYDDLNLIVRLFKRALDAFKAADVPGIIIDLRYNGGGNPLGLAGFLTDQEIPLAQSYTYDEATSQFVKDGIPGRVLPNVEQYSFDNMVLLVGPACASACDQEAYSFSKVPGMIVVGMYPTSGTFADVAGGQIDLPEGFSMQIPTQRFILDDGSLFLEGTGVVPTSKVPINEQTATSEEDVVLQYAEQAALHPLGAGITPATQPTLMSQTDTASALSSMQQFEQLAREQYTNDDYLKVPNTFTFTVPLKTSQELLWAWGWCAKDQATLTDNISKMKVTFALNGQDVPVGKFLLQNYDSNGQKCMAYLLGVTDWAAGEHHAVTSLTFTAPLNDGTYDYPAGVQTFNYNVYVKP